MSVNPMTNAKTPDFRNAHAALLRAAEAARAAAKQFNTPVIVQQNVQSIKLNVQ